MASSTSLSQTDPSVMPTNTSLKSHSQSPEEIQHDSITSKRQSQRHSSITSAQGNGISQLTTIKSNPSGTTERVSTSYSMSSRLTRNSTNTRSENTAANRVARTLPPWIDSYEADDGEPPPSRATDRLLPPSPVHSATHHFGSTPTVTAPATPSQRKRVSRDGWVDDDDAESSTLPVERTPERNLFGAIQKTERGRKWDHARSGAPIILQQSGSDQSSWIPFIKASMYGPAPNEPGQRVEPEFLRGLTPGYEKPWIGDLEEQEGKNALGLSQKHRRRRVWYQRIQHTLLTHPLVPLAFRLLTFSTSVIALGISTHIFILSKVPNISQSSSTFMAIIVDVIAMIYIPYMTWDEYTGQPLGLRSPKVKIRLVLLDVLFIIFESANLSLAFSALTDEHGICNKDDKQDVCGFQAALGVIILLALIAWVLTFSVSIFRLVERAGGRQEED